MIPYLVKQGANINAVNWVSLMPIWWIFTAESTNLNYVLQQGNTALHLAAEKNSLLLFETLWKNGHPDLWIKNNVSPALSFLHWCILINVCVSRKVWFLHYWPWKNFIQWNFLYLLSWKADLTSVDLFCTARGQIFASRWRFPFATSLVFLFGVYSNM